jgi:hypothetical protein
VRFRHELNLTDRCKSIFAALPDNFLMTPDICTTHDHIAKLLIAGRRPYDEPAPSEPGIYALFLKPRGQLPPIAPGAHRLLYIAMTRGGMDGQNPFSVANSGFSMLRRTLGAILRTHLWLQPAPRAPGQSAAHARNYAFAVDGEAVLSRWMRANLLVSLLALPAADLDRIETELIGELQPPLNLTGWDNPQRALIKRLRADCVRLAKAQARLAA